MSLLSGMEYAIYHETLSAALDEASSYATRKGCVVAIRELYEPFNYGGINYGETKDSHATILSIDGNNTRKKFHTVIYRMDSGRYELTCYIL